MKAKLFKNKISVKPSKIHNYGVFADKNIRKGEIIEECYAIMIEPVASTIRDFTFLNPNNGTLMAPLGNGMIYNHSYKPNALYNFRASDIFEVKAARFIRAGEEILVTYGRQYMEDRNLTSIEFPVRTGLINPVTITLTRMILMTGALYGAYILLTHYLKPWVTFMSSFNISSIALP